MLKTVRISEASWRVMEEHSTDLKVWREEFRAMAGSRIRKAEPPPEISADLEEGTPSREAEQGVAEWFGIRNMGVSGMGGDLAPNLGSTKNCFRGPISGKMSIFRVKISDDLFFSHRLGSSDFPFLFSHFPYVYYVKCRI